MVRRLALTYTNLVYVEDQPHPRHILDLYIPNGPGVYPLLVWIHGGAWWAGDKESDLPPEIMTLTNYGYAVASINYRLSHDAIFPAQIHDVKAAIRWLRANAGEYLIDPQRVGVAGHSAGGHLAALAGTTSNNASVESLGMGNAAYSSEVHMVATFSGPTDFLQMTSQEPEGCNEINHDAPDSPESSLIGCPIQSCPDVAGSANPISYISGDEPPFWIQHGKNDCIVPAGQAEILYDELVANGSLASLTIVEDAGHAFEFPEEALRFFDEHLRR